VGRSVESECLWSGIEKLDVLMQLLNFHVEIPTLNRSNSTIKVGFSSPLQGKTSESYIFPTTFKSQFTKMCSKFKPNRQKM
jgi:hypothetical protein